MSRIAAVILAAGPSRRFAEAAEASGAVDAPRFKQLLELDGESLVRRVSRVAITAQLDPILVVIGCRAAEVRSAIADLPVRTVENARYLDGQSTSVQAGLRRLPPDVAGALFIPCDQPLLDAPTLEALRDAHRNTRASIVVPTFGGRRGSPVLFARDLFDELSRISGDAGGRQLFGEYADQITEVELDSELPLLDVDTPADFDELVAYLRRSL